MLSDFQVATNNRKNNLPVFFTGSDRIARRLGSHLQRLALTCCPPPCWSSSNASEAPSTHAFPFVGSENSWFTTRRLNASSTTPSTTQGSPGPALSSEKDLWEVIAMVSSLLALVIVCLLLVGLGLRLKRRSALETACQKLSARKRQADVAAQAAETRHHPGIELQDMSSRATSYYSMRDNESVTTEISSV